MAPGGATWGCAWCASSEPGPPAPGRAAPVQAPRRAVGYVPPGGLPLRSTLAAALALLFAPGLRAAPPAPLAPTPPAPRATQVAAAPRAVDPAMLAAYVDGAVTEARRVMGIPGVAVVAVQAGEVILARGYGHADLASGREVDPATTVWPVFSCSKPIVSTAILQLVDEGRLGLDDPIEQHLGGLRLEGDFAEPIRVRHLMTQTSGLDETITELLVPPGSSASPLGEYLARSAPPRVRPPGEIFQYSFGHNHTLLGRILETASGQGFDDRIEDSLLRPLGMPAATFRDHAAPGPHEALGYGALSCLRRVPTRADTARLQIRPGGGLRATALEMARFLELVLEGGVVDGRRLLSERAVEGLTHQAFTMDPALPGQTLGFFRQGQALEHAGGPFPHMSSMQLVPRHRFGIFFAANTQSGGRLMAALHRDLLRRFFPDALEEGERPSAAPGAPEATTPRAATTASSPGATPSAPAPLDLREFEGVYRGAWRPRRGPAALMPLLATFPELRVRVSGKDTLSLGWVGWIFQLHARHVEGDRFDRGEDLGPLVFHRDAQGRPDRIYTGLLMPGTTFPFVLERIEPHQARDLQALAGALLILATLIAGPLASLGSLLAIGQGRWTDAAFRAFSSLAATAALVLPLAPLAAVLDSPGAGPGLLFGMPASAEALAALAPLAAGLAFVQLGVAARLLREARARPLTRLHAVTAAAAAVGLVVWGRNWGLV